MEPNSINKPSLLGEGWGGACRQNLSFANIPNALPQEREFVCVSESESVCALMPQS